jgi:PAS domain S-box-containing protein
LPSTRKPRHANLSATASVRSASAGKKAATGSARGKLAAVQKTRLIRRGDSTLRDLIQKTPAATFIFSEKRNQLVNPAAEALTGYTSHELLKMNFWEILHSDYQKMVKQRGQARLRGVKTLPRYEVKIIRKDGTERWLEYCGAPIKYQGKAAVIGTAIDITERKLAEERLQQNLNRLRLVHETTVASMSTLDLKRVLEIFLDKVDAVLPCPIVASIRVVDAETGALNAKALRNLAESDFERFAPLSAEGLTRIALERKSPVIVEDARVDPSIQYPEFFDQLGLVSYLRLPLLFGNTILGDLSFFTREKHHFTDEELALLQSLANQAAIAIHNSQLYDVMRRKTREFSALNALTIATSQSLDLNAVLNEAVKSIVELFRFDGAAIYLFDEVLNEAYLKSSFTAEPGSWGRVKVVRRDEGIIGTVARNCEPVIIEDISSDPRYDQYSQTGAAKKAGARFFAAFPIRSKLKTWGALSCIVMKPKRLESEEIDLLIAMGQQIGIAIENASLYGNTADKAKELSALYAIAGISAQFVDMNALLFQSMRKLCEIFGFAAARVYVVDKSTGESRLAATDGLASDSMAPKKYRKGEGLIGLVIERGEPLAFEDMGSDPKYHRLADRKTMLNAGFRASLFIPLNVRGETLGVMNLLDKEARSFSANELQLINATAYHLGIAIGNANLFAQLRGKTDDLEKANKAKDEFLAIMSHELRTPVNVISGYLDLMLQGACGSLAPQLEARLLKVSTHTKSLLAMIEGILIATGIETGTLRLIPGECDVGALLNRLRLMYELPLGKSVETVWNIPERPIVMTTDAEKLKRILQNLVDNAIKFTDAGCITVSARLQSGDDRIDFTVSDTGEGIAPDKLGEIFGIFRQLDSSVTRAHGGIGLGLYIVKQLTELLGGQVTVQSEIGKGSAFTVSLPLRESPVNEIH